MPRQCISKRIKNIEERKKTYNPVTFLHNPQTTFWKCATSVKVWHAMAALMLLS